MNRFVPILSIALALLVGCGTDTEPEAPSQAVAKPVRFSGQISALATKCGFPSPIDARFAIWEMTGDSLLPEQGLQRHAKSLLEASDGCQLARFWLRRFNRKAAPAPKPKPKPVKPSGGVKLNLTPKQRGIFAEARTVCGLFPASKVASDYGMPPDSDLTAIAAEYAKGYSDITLSGAAEMGCYDGLVTNQNSGG